MATWGLDGYDTFEGEYYPLETELPDEPTARRHAADRLQELERTQPGASSGGQGDNGIQDRVYLVSPSGKRYRYTG